MGDSTPNARESGISPHLWGNMALGKVSLFARLEIANIKTVSSTHNIKNARIDFSFAKVNHGIVIIVGV